MLHDAGDAILGFAKMFKYANLNSIADLIFAIFTVMFMYLRMMLLPFTLIPSGSWEVAQVGRLAKVAIPGWWPMNIFLLSLQALHFYWGKLLLEAVYRTLHTGKLE